MKIRSRGPVLVTLKNGNQLDLWYDRNIRLWTLQVKDPAGNQIGPGSKGEAEHYYHRQDAVDDIQNLVATDEAEPVTATGPAAATAWDAHTEKTLREDMAKAQAAVDRCESALDAYFRPKVKAALEAGDVALARNFVTRCGESVTQVFLLDAISEHMKKTKKTSPTGAPS